MNQQAFKDLVNGGSPVSALVLLLSGELSDITVYIGKQKFALHKWVLEYHSNTFKKMFEKFSGANVLPLEDKRGGYETFWSIVKRWYGYDEQVQVQPLNEALNIIEWCSYLECQTPRIEIGDDMKINFEKRTIGYMNDHISFSNFISRDKNSGEIILSAGPEDPVVTWINVFISRGNKKLSSVQIRFKDEWDREYDGHKTHVSYYPTDISIAVNDTVIHRQGYESDDSYFTRSIVYNLYK